MTVDLPNPYDTTAARPGGGVRQRALALVLAAPAALGATAVALAPAAHAESEPPAAVDAVVPADTVQSGGNMLSPEDLALLAELSERCGVDLCLVPETTVPASTAEATPALPTQISIPESCGGTPGVGPRAPGILALPASGDAAAWPVYEERSKQLAEDYQEAREEWQAQYDAWLDCGTS